MKVDVLLGLQWGDEGKGKIVDVLTPNYDIIARFQGGPNAGHTLEFEGVKHVLHTIPSGIFHANVINLIGNGVVIDPVVFQKELEKLAPFNINIQERLVLSKKAHLILPSHRLLDAASETAKGKNKIGSTLKGIGPTYMDKTGRNGLRVGDIFLPTFKQKYDALVEKHIGMLKHYEGFEYNLAELEGPWMEGIEILRGLKAVDSEHYLDQALRAGKKILAEGAQGTMLDIDFGTYPYVTSSNTVTAGTCTGLGVAPSKIGNVIGIFKAYCTRVGSGPFPTELLDEVGEQIRQEGREFGSTTGRPRRCGWIDLPAIKYAIMINGVTELAMMKSDVLDKFDTIRACTKYRINGEEIDYLPYDIDGVTIEPIWEDIPGWGQDLTALTSFGAAPQALKDYVTYLERHLEVPITTVSVGPDRKQTLVTR
ncbi:MAG: adenylosuccinate synthase [Candidatus Fluviicola riflensis]|nr:MAG: adenylosuccinate synthase [Candidatus Fluviicola riflensis]OGS76452.1 MAG: adenylosuccinate synthase [Candidatus Fluviicola riflensis]OGS82746.1 MAG: adenylosuccinate synthase [Fluviicola sp. RIFCSPHIGHO2_01_FULL_43_53]OGS89045.1 MAG: adenylosuccinate synthase [Fluviicola sp. RIFCSPHIGHO2_12_FULL_43_24]